MAGDYFNEAWACRVTGLHRTTIARMRQRQRVRPELVRLAAIELGGAIGLIHDAWDGWRLCRKNGLLQTPCGWEFRPGELLAMPIRYQELAALRAEVEDLRRTSSKSETRALEDRLKRLVAELEDVAFAVSRLRGRPGLAAVDGKSNALPVEAPAA